ncbi:HEAT repeat domain-containing protein [Streptomyces arboris]|uniref:HEAT repeat domain-containing protein n=1 Tax=Streptomyces arboris TaxID=2600619 RepID=A0A5N5EAX4_9ACTN|nr:HEAT repeat domain-containing protein [Streptomyces arboris]KAB2587506.1 HEAT repeat domain-containing protein [Streptomyces arboris]
MIKEHNRYPLTGLDDIAWERLHHAYGSARDVPDWLRLVCGNDEEARKDAWMHLFNTIFHQGSRYTSSAAAVPFFARIAIAGPAHARPNALEMLTRLAIDWHDQYTLPTGINTSAWRAAAAEGTPEKMAAWYQEQLDAETDPGRCLFFEEARDYCLEGATPEDAASKLPSYDAVRAELSGLCPLLDDMDPDIRVRIAYLLAWFPEEGPRTVPELLARLDRESHAQVTATMLVAAGLVGDRSLVPHLRSYLAALEPLVRWGAAIALARLLTTDCRPGADDEEVVALVIEELTQAITTPPTVSHMPEAVFNDGDLGGYAARALAPLAALARRPVLPVIMDALSANSAFAAEAVTAALQNALPGEGLHGTPFTDLGESTQHILRCVAARGPWDEYETPVENCLRAVGLPDTRPRLHAYVQLTAPTVPS